MPYQPRWQLYIDAEPSPTTWGFMAWIGACWREWERLNGLSAHASKTMAMHEEFDAWLQKSWRG